jgi:hypothetical protein
MNPNTNINQNQNQDPDKSKNTKLPAKAYIEKHNLEPILSELLNTLVSKRINKPENYMVINIILLIKLKLIKLIKLIKLN